MVRPTFCLLQDVDILIPEVPRRDSSFESTDVVETQAQTQVNLTLFTLNFKLEATILIVRQYSSYKAYLSTSSTIQVVSNFTEYEAYFDFIDSKTGEWPY